MSQVLAAPEPEPGYGNHHGTHLHCTEVPAQVTKRFCATVWETACTTETKTYSVITGYENDDCRERCWRKKRSPGEACVKKTFCTKKPKKEKKTEDYEVCKDFPEEVKLSRPQLYLRKCIEYCRFVKTDKF